jgi:ribonucleoside-diphosphate reductase alpha chain
MEPNLKPQQPSSKSQSSDASSNGAAVQVNPEPDMQEYSELNPLRVVLDHRPAGDLDAVNTCIEFIATDGNKKVYLSVSFGDVHGVVNGQKVTIQRPLEIFIPSCQSDVPQEWISSFARLLSLNARSGLLVKALQDARQVTSDRGPTRYGWYEKDDGTKVPRFHKSEVGAIAFAIQQILFQKGFVDANGYQLPIDQVLARQKGSLSRATDHPAKYEKQDQVVETHSVSAHQSQHGKECRSCGAKAVIKKDGCEFCTNCGEVGSCG